MLKLSICILLFLGTQTYFLPHRLGQLSSSDFDLFKIRVELTIKKFNFALHEKTLATIYRNKTEFDILFSF